MAGHEANDVVELVVAEISAQKVAELLFLAGRQLETEILFDGVLRLVAHHILQLGAQHFANGAVKSQRLRHSHAMQLDARHEQSGARKESDHITGTAGWETEILGLDQ